MQRYKCQNCNATFTNSTIKNLKASKNKRLVFQLILAGCEVDDVADALDIPKKIIKKWIRQHFNELSELIPRDQLLALDTLIAIFSAMEKHHISSLNRKGYGRRFGTGRR